MNDIKELIASIKISIAKMSERIATDVGKYVMVNDTYVQVEEGKGLNGSSLLVRCPIASCKAICFASVDEAYLNGEYYFKDGAGQPIQLQAILAIEFLSEEITKATEMLDFISKILCTLPDLDEKVSEYKETEYIPKEGAEPEKCILISCDKGSFRIVPIYYDLYRVKQVVVQTRIDDRWVFVATHACLIESITTKKIAYDLICKSVGT